MSSSSRTDRILRVRTIQHRAAQATAADAAASVARSDAQSAHLDVLCRHVAPPPGLLGGTAFASASECAMRLGNGRLSVMKHRASLWTDEAAARAQVSTARIAERSAGHLAEQARERAEKAADSKRIRQASVRQGGVR